MRHIPAALAAVYLAWSSTFLAMRVAVAHLPPILMAGLRHTAAGVLLYALARARGASAPTPAQWGASAVLGVLLLAVGNGAAAYALQWSSSSLAAMLFASVPLLAALLGGLLGVWPRRREWIGLALGAAGVLVLAAHNGAHAGPGVAWLLVGALATAGGAVIARRLKLPGGLMSVAAQLLTGGAALLAVAAARGERIPEVVPAQAWLALAYLVFIGSLVGYTAYSYLLGAARPSVATSNNLVNPVIATLLGALVLGEPIAATSVGGMAMVLVGLLLVTWASQPQVAIAARFSHRTGSGSKHEELDLGFDSHAPRWKNRW